MSLAGALIRGIGTAVPPHGILQEKTAEMAKALNCRTPEEEKFLISLYRKSKVEHRYSVFSEHDSPQSFTNFFNHRKPGDPAPGTADRMDCYRIQAPELAEKSSREALSNSAVSAADITHLVTVSCTGFYAPGFDVELIRRLGLRADIARTHVGFMGCHGVFNGLRVAAALAKESPSHRVLLCAVEICSIHFASGWDKERIVANALFADGSAACVVSADLGQGDLGGWEIRHQGSCVFPASQEAMSWAIGDEGFEMGLSPLIPDLIRRNVPEWLDRWLGQQGLSRAAVKTWAVHPGGPKVLDGMISALSLVDEQVSVSRGVLASYGNMSSATILFILRELFATRVEGPLLALGFGPGLTVESALLTRVR